MKYVRLAFVASMLSMLMLVGCGLTSAQRQRIDALAAENEALYLKERELVAKIETGEATPAELAEAFRAISGQMKKNVDEIKEIKDSGSTAAWISAAVGLFGRTALHAVGAAVPGGGPAAAVLQGLLTLLLGGSSTKKPEAKAPTA